MPLESSFSVTVRVTSWEAPSVLMWEGVRLKAVTLGGVVSLEVASLVTRVAAAPNSAARSALLSGLPLPAVSPMPMLASHSPPWLPLGSTTEPTYVPLSGVPKMRSRPTMLLAWALPGRCSPQQQAVPTPERSSVMVTVSVTVCAADVVSKRAGERLKEVTSGGVTSSAGAGAAATRSTAHAAAISAPSRRILPLRLRPWTVMAPPDPDCAPRMLGRYYAPRVAGARRRGRLRAPSG